MSFEGLRVLSLESWRAHDMQTLILREGGVPFVAPSVREEAVDSGIRLSSLWNNWRTEGSTW